MRFILLFLFIVIISSILIYVDLNNTTDVVKTITIKEIYNTTEKMYIISDDYPSNIYIINTTDDLHINDTITVYINETPVTKKFEIISYRKR